MNLKTNYREFQQEINSRGIEYLVHFTPTINLYSIFEQGKLMSRKMLESLDISQCDLFDYVQFTDNLRLDDKSYINLSISGPNTRLLYVFQQKTKDDPCIHWCVLKIDPKYIYEKETLFAVTNAASNMAKRIGVSGDLDKFKMLFADEVNGTKRGEIKLKYPTDLQAEVLVKDEIPIEAIIAVCFDTDQSMMATKAALVQYDTSKFIVDKDIFKPRRII